MRLAGFIASATALSLLGLVACGTDSSTGADTQAGGASGPRFLLASQEGIGETTAGGPRRLILKWDDKSYALDPALSPDGKLLAFVLQPPAKPLPDGAVDFGSDLYTADIEGKGQKQLVKHQRIADFIRSPAWISANELLYAYRGRNAQGTGDFRIERLDVASGRTVRYIEWGVDPAVSKDRKKIVYVAVDPVTQEETLTVSGVDLSDKRGIVSSASKLALYSSPVFSPDGTRIAFAAVDLNQPLPGGLGAPTGRGTYASHPFAEDVWIVNVDGSGLRRLAEIAENMPSLTWSGDGSSLYALGPQAWWRIDPATGKAEQIAQGIPLGQIVWLSGR